MTTIDRKVGVLGGGQLGRMMAEAAARMGVKMTCLDPLGTASPTGMVCGSAVTGAFTDPAKIRELAEMVDVLTVEIEHVDAEGLAKVEKEAGAVIHPSPSTIALIQDKLLQKQHLSGVSGVALGEYCDIPDTAALLAAGERWGYPIMLKTRKNAYDGRGNLPVRSAAEAASAFTTLSNDGKAALYAEKWCDFEKELAVMVARSAGGRVEAYPIVETVQLDSMCHTVVAPAQVPRGAMAAAKEVAMKAIASLSGGGIFGVELFLTKDGGVLLNEIAPRPHNSGHYTMDGLCATDQFEQHLRCVLDLPLGSTEMRVPAAGMLNVIGTSDGLLATTSKPLNRALSMRNAHVHWYGKAPPKARRKMGHINVSGPSVAAVQAAIDALQKDEAGAAEEVNGVAVAAGGKRKRVSKKEGGAGATDAAAVASPAAIAAAEAAAAVPIVGIIMGSDSDLPTMKAAAEILDEFKVPYELTIVSAHRTPQRMYEYAQSASNRGLRCIIAGAGGAAHLPGMVAAITPLPVIGVPVKSSALSGNDSLLSIVQMPKGIPVATVAIGNAANAGLLAVRMLGMADHTLLDKMADYMSGQESTVLEKASRLEDVGYKGYEP
jgi:phosphoribosylaminoimidazole carboxylase